jgi:hypothetical protein
MSGESLHPADEKHEQRDVHRPMLVISALCFAGFIALSVTVLWFAYGEREGGFAAAQPRESVLANGELGQRTQLANYLKAQQDFLDKLAWTDASQQFAKVPIEDAMRLLAAKGANRPRPAGAPQ